MQKNTQPPAELPQSNGTKPIKNNLFTTLSHIIIWQGRILQSDWSIWGPDFAVMPSAAVAGHYKIFNALQNKTEQNSENTSLFFKKCKLL